MYLDAIEGGRVEEIFVEAGAWVEKGDEILLLSNTNLVLNLMQREAEYYNLSDNLQKSRLSLEQNRLNFITTLNDLDYQIQTEKRQCDENRPLFEKGLISKSKFEPMEEKYEYLVEKRKLAIRDHEQETQLREVQIAQFEASLKRMESNLDIVKDKLDELTVFENVELPLLYLSYSSSVRKKRVDEVLEQVGIAHRRNHFPQQLSGGQQQRVAVARAVVAEPKIILADEPTGNLDTKHGEEVMTMLLDLHKEGATIVMVTHSLEYADYAQRTIGLLDGSVVEEG